MKTKKLIVTLLTASSLLVMAGVSFADGNIIIKNNSRYSVGFGANYTNKDLRECMHVYDGEMVSDIFTGITLEPHSQYNSENTVNGGYSPADNEFTNFLKQCPSANNNIKDLFDFVPGNYPMYLFDENGSFSESKAPAALPSNLISTSGSINHTMIIEINDFNIKYSTVE